ncbi:MAG: TVP38/TMEM64 family protein [Pirellulaceae bacterium]|nr:TVP38/TMEM64 family protein [Pirellulaceae bacterium]
MAAAIIALFIYEFGDLLSLESLATKESQLRDFQNQHPWLVYGVAFLVYVVVTGLSLPGAAALTLVFGWYFGFWRALLMISFASTIGATIAFLLSRYLLRDTVQGRFGDRLSSFNEQLEKEGAFYLFTLRLIPAFPFFVINLVMGLTPLRARTFYWVSQIGMLPGTAVYAYAGSRVPDLNTLAQDGAGAVFSTGQLTQLAIAFGLLGIFPLATKKILGHFRKSPLPSDD